MAPNVCINLNIEWFDSNYRKGKDQYLADLTRDNVQLIVNELWQQPTERFEETIVAKLPAPSFVLPRSRKCPVPRPLTKWEKFAQEKGIKKTKKDKKVFDDELEVRPFTLSSTEFFFEWIFIKIVRILLTEMGTNVWF